MAGTVCAIQGDTRQHDTSVEALTIDRILQAAADKKQTLTQSQSQP